MAYQGKTIFNKLTGIETLFVRTGKDTGAPIRDEPGTNAIKRLTLGLLAFLPVEWMM